ncbi:hypothetical protein FF38_09443 [Lucilia cuprina]|uniref:C-type lectin domain-containing protein n=1 Tax=Lucilia cuprina TaxID=7375 RepID=A0A0L0C900_LUCCU|nr:hypothetical protein FF38_09443 [Lucilia cuprina]
MFQLFKMHINKLLTMKYFVSILLIISIVGSVPVRKWHRSNDGSLYFIEAEEKYNWFEAWNECARKNMSLMAIDTLYKHTQIDTLLRRIFPTSPSLWISGHDNAVDRRYEWATSGRVFTFTNWGAGQPDRLNNNEHCILIWHNTWQWYDLPCSRKIGFVCEENVYLKEKNRDILLIATLSGSVPMEKWHRSSDESLYYIETEPKYNWFEAWNECARKNMSLMAIDTFYKHTQIDTLLRRLFPTSPSFWLSGHDNAVDKRYEWATSGEVFSFTNWGPGQPDRLNNNEHCILIWQNTWQWYDLPCSHKLGFLCEENIFLKEMNKELSTLKDSCLSNGCKCNNVVLNINKN